MVKIPGRTALIGPRPLKIFSTHLYLEPTYEGGMKSSSLAYNRRETRDKRLLGRDPDKSQIKISSQFKISLSPSISLLKCLCGNPTGLAQQSLPSYAWKWTIYIYFILCFQVFVDMSPLWRKRQSTSSLALVPDSIPSRGQPVQVQ